MERQYKYDVPLFMCWWEDSIGLYTEDELYEEYKTQIYTKKKNRLVGVVLQRSRAC